MNFQCKICFESYDLIKKKPKIFGNCGHDICD